MRVCLILAVAVLLGCGAAHAQSPTSTSTMGSATGSSMGSAMGATSPLGMLGSTTSTGSNSGIERIWDDIDVRQHELYLRRRWIQCDGVNEFNLRLRVEERNFERLCLATVNV